MFVCKPLHLYWETWQDIDTAGAFESPRVLLLAQMGMTPLACSSSHGHIAVAALLISKGAKLDTQDLVSQCEGLVYSKWIEPAKVESSNLFCGKLRCSLQWGRENKSAYHSELAFSPYSVYVLACFAWLVLSLLKGPPLFHQQPNFTNINGNVLHLHA